MQNQSSAHRQISASTIGQYRAMATPYRDGTWNHDVSQNIQALLAALAGAPPYRILDLGCGPGRDLVAFRDLGHVVVGLDGCPEFVAMARTPSGASTILQRATGMTAEYPPSAGWRALPRYPDPAVEVLDERFAPYRIFSAAVERLYTGCRWAEGPVWFGDGRYLLWSDIPNNRILKWEEETGAVSVFRRPTTFANGNTRDRQGRLITCEHGRRLTRTEYDGSITVLMDHWQGKRLNSPNDVVVKSDGSIWFTDPPFGILGNYEGVRAEPELPQAVYRIDPD